jgi:hypothetical protein
MVSHTDLEFCAATDAGLTQRVFLLDEYAAAVPIPSSRLRDNDLGLRRSTGHCGQAAWCGDHGRQVHLLVSDWSCCCSRRGHTRKRRRVNSTNICVRVTFTWRCLLGQGPYRQA